MTGDVTAWRHDVMWRHSMTSCDVMLWQLKSHSEFWSDPMQNTGLQCDIICDVTVWYHDVTWRHKMTSWCHVTSQNDVMTSCDIMAWRHDVMWHHGVTSWRHTQVWTNSFQEGYMYMCLSEQNDSWDCGLWDAGGASTLEHFHRDFELLTICTRGPTLSKKQVQVYWEIRITS